MSLPRYIEGEHETTHVRLGASSFLAGCTCGWIAEPRLSLIAVLMDCMQHAAPYVPQLQMCSDPNCPIDARPPVAEELRRQQNGSKP